MIVVFGVILLTARWVGRNCTTSPSAHSARSAYPLTRGKGTIAGVTYEEAKILLGTLAMTQPRILGLCMMLPLFNRGLLPGLLRHGGGRAGAGAGARAGGGLRQLSGGIGETLLIVAKEAFVGMTMGFIVALPFWIFEAAGFVIDNQRGPAWARP